MQIEEILGTLDFLDVIFPGIVYEREDAVRAMERFYLEKADFIIAEFLSWSEDFAWIRFLRDMPEVPMIFVNVAKERMAFRDTLDEDDFIEYLCSGTLVGSLEGSGSLPRVGRKHVRIVMGSREEVTGRIRTFAAAARVRSLLRQSNLGLLANYNEAMWSTYFDPYALFTKIGPEIHFLPYSTYGEVIDGVNDTVLNAYCDDLTARYRMMDDVDPEKFRASVRASIGLAEMARMSDSDILVFNDIDQAMFRLVGLRAGFYHPWFNENISVLVPEADTGAGLICYILKLLSGRHVNFSNLSTSNPNSEPSPVVTPAPTTTTTPHGRRMWSSHATCASPKPTTATPELRSHGIVSLRGGKHSPSSSKRTDATNSFAEWPSRFRATIF